MIMSLKTMFKLGSCCHMIMLNPWWNPYAEYQTRSTGHIERSHFQSAGRRQIETPDVYMHICVSVQVRVCFYKSESELCSGVYGVGVCNQSRSSVQMYTE